MRWQPTTTKRLLFWAVPATALLAFLAVALRGDPQRVDVAVVTRGPLTVTVDDEGQTQGARHFHRVGTDCRHASANGAARRRCRGRRQNHRCPYPAGGSGTARSARASRSRTCRTRRGSRRAPGAGRTRSRRGGEGVRGRGRGSHARVARERRRIEAGDRRCGACRPIRECRARCRGRDDRGARPRTREGPGSVDDPDSRRRRLRVRRSARADQRARAAHHREERDGSSRGICAARHRRSCTDGDCCRLSLQRGRHAAPRPTRDTRELGRRAPQCDRSRGRADCVHEGVGARHSRTAGQRDPRSDRSAICLGDARSRVSRRRSCGHLGDSRSDAGTADGAVPA